MSKGSTVRRKAAGISMKRDRSVWRTLVAQWKRIETGRKFMAFDVSLNMKLIPATQKSHRSKMLEGTKEEWNGSHECVDGFNVSTMFTYILSKCTNLFLKRCLKCLQSSEGSKESFSPWSNFKFQSNLLRKSHTFREVGRSCIRMRHDSCYSASQSNITSLCTVKDGMFLEGLLNRRRICHIPCAVTTRQWGSWLKWFELQRKWSKISSEFKPFSAAEELVKLIFNKRLSLTDFGFARTF